MIYWIGNSENWDKPIHPNGNMVDSYVFPLVEETVLEVAFSPLYMGYGRLSQQAAINCTSRFALRTTLNAESDSRDLNPRWLAHHDFAEGLVVKAPTSCQNQGIGFALPNEYSRRLMQYDRIAGKIGVVEQYIPGPQYEADGVVLDGEVHLLAWVLQEGENGKIVRYIPAPFPAAPAFPVAPHNVIEMAVKTLGLDNCPFCFEMKNEIPATYPSETNTPSQWKIIDAHARLGEDRRLWGDQAELFERIDRILKEKQ